MSSRPGRPEPEVELFRDRKEAGRKLAGKIKEKGILDGLIMAIPRGGVVVGAEIAGILGFDLDLIIPRKIGAPFNPELAVGAVTQDGTVLMNRSLLDRLGITEESLNPIVREQIAEINRRMTLYRGRTDYPDYDSEEIILVDDGIATGYTVMAALRSLKKMFPSSRIILAAPVAAPDTFRILEDQVDEAISLLLPDEFFAVGQFYYNFEQTTDDEVKLLFRKFCNKKFFKF